jgi:pre-rRNA-processing protein TSR2
MADGAAASSASSSEHAKATLVRAVHVVFGEWTCLRLAVENEWAGSGTRGRALVLLQRVVDGLLASAIVHRDELEDVLDTALVDDFSIEAEDESPRQVAELLCALHTEARMGVTTLADQVLARAAGRSTWVEVPPPPRSRDDDSSDEDCGSDCEMGGDGGGGGSGSQARGEPMDEEAGARHEPEVDEDGFQVVASRKGRGKR